MKQETIEQLNSDLQEYQKKISGGELYTFQAGSKEPAPLKTFEEALEYLDKNFGGVLKRLAEYDRNG